MNRYKFKRVVVKIGSNVLTRADGTLDTTRMSALTDQLAQLHRDGIEVVVATVAWTPYRPDSSFPQSGRSS